MREWVHSAEAAEHDVGRFWDRLNDSMTWFEGGQDILWGSLVIEIVLVLLLSVPTTLGFLVWRLFEFPTVRQ